MFSEVEQIKLLECLINPLSPCSGKMKRVRNSPSKIKALYHIYQLQKNLKTRKWTDIYQAIPTISKGCHVGTTQFSNFINSSDFPLFGEVRHRKGTTSLYCLHDWVYNLFDFLEKKGMMKFFRSDFQKWKKVFITRLHCWLIPLLDKGVSLHQILMNKLSTKRPLKPCDPEPLKPCTIKPKGSSYKALEGSKSNTEQSEISKQIQEMEGLLRFRFQLAEGDIHSFMSTYSLKHLKRAAREYLLWLKRGIVPVSKARLFQKCLQLTKNASFKAS